MPHALRLHPRCFAAWPRATCAASSGGVNDSWCSSMCRGCFPRTSGLCSKNRWRSPRGMPDAVATDVRQRYAELFARLDAADAATDRAALKAEIIELFRAVEREITELAALKEDVKKLAER